MRAVLDGMKAMSNQDKRNYGPIAIEGYDSNSGLVNALNDFYLHFNDEHDFTNVHSDLFESLSDCIATPLSMISAPSVRSMFKKCNIRKSPGPDMITGKLLRVCADQICDMFSELFNLSLTQCKVPELWKESIVVPWLKTKFQKS